MHPFTFMWFIIRKSPPSDGSFKPTLEYLYNRWYKAVLWKLNVWRGSYHSKGVAKPAGGLVGEATKGTNTAQGGSQVGHLVTLRVATGSCGSIASKEDCCWDAIQVGVLWGVSGPVQGNKSHLKDNNSYHYALSSCVCGYMMHLGILNI